MQLTMASRAGLYECKWASPARDTGLKYHGGVSEG